MFRLLICLLFAAAVVAANPVVVTYLSEVSVDPTHQFVELHCAPPPWDTELTNWQLITSTSACTLTCSLRHDEFLVIDSEALAIGDVGHGTFRLNPLGDTIVLHGDTCWVMDNVTFPAYPTQRGSAPLPSPAGSVSFWNHDDFRDQSMNWFIDSTPTPGWENDDYSTISGTVTGIGGITLDEVRVAASGANGCCYCDIELETDYGIGGLGVGKYEVTAYVCHQGQPYQAVYPESVSVGYSENVSGIDFVFPATGVAELRSAPPVSILRVSGRTLLLSGDGTAPVNVQIYNQVGSCISEFRLSPSNGEKRIELPAALAPGVYVASCRLGERTLKTKFVIY